MMNRRNTLLCNYHRCEGVLIKLFYQFSKKNPRFSISPKFELRADEFEYNLKKTLQRDIEKFRYRSISAAQKLLHF